MKKILWIIIVLIILSIFFVILFRGGDEEPLPRRNVEDIIRDAFDDTRIVEPGKDKG